MDRTQFEKEKEEIKNWHPPSPHRVKFLRRVFQIEQWVRANGWKSDEEIVIYTMKHFNLERESAKQYLKQVIEDFKRNGIRVIPNPGRN